VDEDVGERGRRVPDVSRLLEVEQELADQPVDGLGVMVGVGLAVLADVADAGDDRYVTRINRLS
jgi:hypothetical protein